MAMSVKYSSKFVGPSSVNGDVSKWVKGEKKTA